MAKSKLPLPIRIHKRLSRQDKFYGLTTVGARGQVVIPAEARADLALEPGDQLVVIGKFGKALGFIKAEQLEELAKIVMKNFEVRGGDGRQIKSYIEKVFKSQLSKS